MAARMASSELFQSTLPAKGATCTERARPDGSHPIPRKEEKMAPKIRAIGAFRPRIDQGKTAQKPELLRAASRATGLVEGTFDLSIRELRDQIIEFCRAGRAVKIDGLGTWTPNLKMDGSFDIQYRADNALVKGLNFPGVFSGDIINAENIGKSSDDLVAMWNEAYPEDLVEAA